ncbi:MAG: SurA N-terminal domain-containing protein [Paracoccaceae bacterium]
MAKTTGKRYGVWIIVILLFVGLLGFGTGGLTGNLRTIGTVGSKEITVAAYQSELTQQINAFEQQMGNQISMDEARQMGVDQMALQRLVQQRALDNEASLIGLSVGDERVRDEVLRVPAFTNLQGDFDRAAYAETLRQNGLTETTFEDSLREDLTRTLLQGAVVGGIPAPQAYAETLVTFIAEERSITMATVTADDLDAPVPGPSANEIEAYYDANPEDFTTPETREISYALLTPDMIQGELEVDEGSVRSLYEERAEQFIRPERRLVERLVFGTEERAETAKARIDSGEITFDALVDERGLDLSDIDLGDVSRDDIGEAADPVFEASAGDVVGPEPSSLGPALFRVNAILGAEETPFEEAEPELRAELGAGRARRVIEAMIEDINDMIASGFTVEDLADQTDLELGTISLAEGSRDGPAAYEAFREAAAELEEGAFLDVTELMDGGIAVLRLDSVTAPTVEPLTEVTPRARELATAAKQQEAVMAHATELADRIDPLTTFDTLGLEPRTVQNITRRGFVEGTPAGFVDEVFDMDVSDVRVIDGGDDGAVIVRLDTVADPVEDGPRQTAELEAVAESAAQGIAQDIFNAYSRAVQTRTDVTIDESAVNAVNAQLQ